MWITAGLMACIAFLLLPVAARAQLLNGPESIIYDSLNNRYLVSNWVDGSIVEIDSNGVQSYFYTGQPNCGASQIMGNVFYSASAHRIIGINMSTHFITTNVNIPEATLLNAMTADNAGYLYITDALPGIIYKVDVDMLDYTVLVDSDLPTPIGIHYDEENNRLLVTNAGSRIFGVSLPDGTVTELAYTGLGYMDAIAEDPDGNYYVSCSTVDEVYKLDHTLSNEPQLFSSGHNWPSQLCYNHRDYILVVPNFNSNSIDFIEDPYKHDDDGDGHYNALDNCPESYNPGQEDADSDGFGDECDNCPGSFNPTQTDINNNGIGDSCEVPETWHIQADGLGDVPTLREAIDSSSHGDTILVAAGVYAGADNSDLDFKGRLRLLVVSEQGAGSTIIDCLAGPSDPRRGFTIKNGQDSTTIVDGFTIRGGYGPVFNGSNGGGGILIADAAPTIRNCVIVNCAALMGGALYVFNAAPRLTNCTFVSNSGDYGAAIFSFNNSEPLLKNAILAFNEGSQPAVCMEYSSVNLSCCDVYDNLPGDYVGCLAGAEGINGNFSADPLFCSVMGQDFGLRDDSPCAAAFNECGVLIGARETGCPCVCDSFCDLNLDGGINPVDVVYLVNYVYKQYDDREQLLSCPADNGDWNCDQAVNPVDVVYYVNFVYKSQGSGPCDPCLP